MSREDHSFYLSLAPPAASDIFSTWKAIAMALREVYTKNVKTFPDIMGSLLIEIIHSAHRA